MTDETANLVLELLRNMRGDMDGLRREIAELRAEMRDRFSAVDEHLNAVDAQVEGLRYVFVASVGSLVSDVKDHDARIGRLEETPT